MNTDVKFTSLVELTRYFSDEKKCVEHLEQLRWNGQRACPHCGSVKTYVCKGLGKYKCGDCKHRFSVITKTFFESSKIPLSKWFIAMYLCLSHKKGVSSHQLARDLDTTQKTAWFILHRIRCLVLERKPNLLGGIVEMDETYVGGKDRFKSLKKRKELHKQTLETGKSWKSEKAVVVGALERNGKLILKHVSNSFKETLEPFVTQNVKEGSRVFTDEHYSYSGLGKTYKHQTVTHSLKIYAIGDVHTNSIESAFSHFKRSIYGIHHYISVKHLQKYAVAFAFRFSTRKATEQQRFDLALTKCDEGRLTYWDLIKNDKKVSVFERNNEVLK